MAYKLNVNSEVHVADVEPDTPLLWVLRDALGILGPKYGCGVGACGACTVHLNDRAVRSCQIPISAVRTARIATIEGMGSHSVGVRVQTAWSALDVAQCGYCQPGQIMAATALLSANAKPTDAEIDAAMSGNICRCATYNRIRSAIKMASGQSVEP